MTASATAVRYFPDGKQLLGSGIEPGHGVRDYLIDLSSGAGKPVTPEGVAGTRLSPDGRSVAVSGPDGKWGVWPLDGSGLRPIPGLDSKYYVVGWKTATERNIGICGAERVARNRSEYLSCECNDREDGIVEDTWSEYSRRSCIRGRATFLPRQRRICVSLFSGTLAGICGERIEVKVIESFARSLCASMIQWLNGSMAK